MGWLVGVRVGVGELLGEGDGLGVGRDGVGEGWLGAGDGWLGAGAGAAVAEAVGGGVSVLGAEAGLLVDAAPGAVPADEAVTAIMIPATSATMPPMTPAASNSRVQVEIGSVPDPSPVNGGASQGLAGLARRLPPGVWYWPSLARKEYLGAQISGGDGGVPAAAAA